MRMAGPDVVLFLVGLLLFSGATAAIVAREGGVDAFTGSGSASGIYNVAYATRVIEGEESAVPSWASATVDFDVNNTQVSRVILVVECADNVPVAAAPYTLTIEVSAPNNLTVEPITVPCGSTEVPIDVTSVPAATSVQGRTEEEAAGNLGQDANATKAVGTWTFTVTGSRGSAPSALPVPAPSNGRLALNVEAWEPSFTPVQK